MDVIHVLALQCGYRMRSGEACPRPALTLAKDLRIQFCPRHMWSYLRLQGVDPAELAAQLRDVMKERAVEALREAGENGDPS